MQGGGTLGQRFGAQKKLGILFGGTYDYNGRGINDIEPSPTTKSLTPHYDEMDIRDYVYDRTRWGATTGLAIRYVPLLTYFVQFESACSWLPGS